MMNVFVSTFKRFFKERFYDQAAMLSYYLILSVFPFLLFVLGIVSLLPLSSQDVLDMVKVLVPEQAYALLEANVYSIFDGASAGLVSLSLIPALWISSMAVQSLVRSLNDAYETKRTRAYWQGVLRDIAVTIVFMFVLPFSLLVPIIETMLREIASNFSYVDELLKRYALVWLYWRWTAGTLLLFGVLLLIYKWLPSHRGTFKNSYPGALFATIGILVVSNVFSYYASIANYELFYGQLGAVIILLIWFYTCAAVILLGGLLNAEIIRWQKKESSDTPKNVKDL